MHSWIEFVNYGRDVSPAPGPIINTTLLVVNNEKKVYDARAGLVMTRKTVTGNYRLVSKETWNFFVCVPLECLVVTVQIGLPPSFSTEKIHIFLF